MAPHRCIDRALGPIYPLRRNQLKTAVNNTTTAKKAVHFGAGNIGRGFVACFLHNSGFEVVFANVNASYTDLLTAQPSYKVIETNGADLVREIATADVVICSVGPKNLEFIAPLIAKGIDPRENNIPPDRVNDDRARFANSAIDRIVPAQDPDAGLDIKIEKFHEWVVDRMPFRDYPPSIKGHATAAYYGYNRGKSTIYDALKNRYINNEHTIDKDERYTYADTILQRISNPYLKDAVERVGYSPLRKLSRKERFVSPAAKLADYGKDYSTVLNAIKIAFRLQNIKDDQESVELAKILAEGGPGDVVQGGVRPKSRREAVAPNRSSLDWIRRTARSLQPAALAIS
ncbi:mannitol-1-phosphate 5-dehydrogenase [Cladorrhinum samala]|uniref:Mannitol-1-phosphate 5-dehydrogenase n=1 Tax=Cladorrhinum samala TaxID=585594 RepID=A0AAV9HD09_9PEZI|nr:mannitol-1-phosphate 5-dehydrogenase [Cladorrhinum samala]